MKILQAKQLSNEWEQARKGKITGSILKDVLTKRGNGRKVGFYQLIADRLAIEPDDEDVMDRGLRLEQEAADLFAKEHKLELHQDGLWISDENHNIAVSPDKVIIIDDIRRGAVEIKCLSSARHLQIVLEDKIPTEYYDQVLQYFIVNDDLTTLHFVSYDPRVQAKPLHTITITRDEVTDDIEKYKEMETQLLAEVEEAVERLAF